MGKVIIIKGADFSANAIDNIAHSDIDYYINPVYKSANSMPYTFLRTSDMRADGRFSTASSYERGSYAIDVSGINGKTIHISKVHYKIADTSTSWSGIQYNESYTMLVLPDTISSVNAAANNNTYKTNAIFENFPNAEKGAVVNEFDYVIPNGAKTIVINEQTTGVAPIVYVKKQ